MGLVTVWVVLKGNQRETRSFGATFLRHLVSASAGWKSTFAYTFGSEVSVGTLNTHGA